MHDKTKVGASYRAKSPEQQQSTYDDWAARYENDLCAMGYRLPGVAAALFCRFVPISSSPILDAGCGGGIQAEPLFHAGYSNITGIDFSQGMLDIAKQKDIYTELKRMTLGGKLDFEDNHFAAVYSVGTITPKHAPASSFADLIRITQTGGLLIFSMRNDVAQEPEYPETIERYAEQRQWREIYTTDGFQSMPYGEPEITHRVHVYEKL